MLTLASQKIKNKVKIRLRREGYGGQEFFEIMK